MEIVTLVHLKLNRIGTAKSHGGAFGGRRSLERFVEASNAEPETVRELVIKVAEENGEAPGSLEELRFEQRYEAERLVFNIQGINTFYGDPYVECEVFTALKSGDRYFRLEEIAVKG